MGSSVWLSKRHYVLKVELLNDKRVLSISLGPFNPRPLEPLSFIRLLNTQAGVIPDLSFGGLLEFA
jgi:hypothetical protein